MYNNMKIGDKVRFLSETGGGIVSGFQGKNIVLVEDADGFEIPFPITEVVVVGNEDYNTGKMVSSKKPVNDSSCVSSAKRVLNDISEEDEQDYDPSDNFEMPVVERQGGDALSAYLAFVPVDSRNIASTTFETYIVNDSNYYMYFSYLTAENDSWTMRAVGEVEPNTKLFIEEFTKERLNSMSHVTVQILPYKRDKVFKLKSALDVRFRIDGVKFYKLNTFTENDFFESPALIYTIVENDKVKHQLTVDSVAVKEAMYAKTDAVDKPSRKDNTSNNTVRRYEKDQSKSRHFKQRLQGDKIVVDLHINELLDTTAGMNANAILDYQLEVFRTTLEKYKNKFGQKIIFIHGKGEGVLRHSIIHELNYKYKGYQYQDASFQEYGYGATQVTIGKLRV